jgi:hypothetical protein
MEKKEKIKSFMILSVLILLFVNLTLISGYILITKYGSMTLSPGEKYIVNIPFIPTPETTTKSPIVCGTAEENDGTPVKDVEVRITYSTANTTILGENITDEEGKYCITLPEITSDKTYNVYLEYDNETSSSQITLGNNDYSLNFENNINYSKASNTSVYLTGYISNKDAKVENGRLEITLSRCEGETNTCNSIIDNKKYSINIDSNEVYHVPNPELDYSWPISSAETGKYKMYVEASFNAQDHTTTRYLHITD